MKKKSVSKKVKSSVYYDEDVSIMLQELSDEYYLLRSRILNMVLR